MTSSSFKLRPGRVLAAAMLAAVLLPACSRGDGPPATAASDERVLMASHDAEARTAGSASASTFGDYLAGLYASRQRDLAAAAGFMARALAGDPENPTLLHQTFMLMATEGRMAEARQLAGRLLESNRTHGPAALLIALEHVRAGELDQARSVLARLPERGLAALTGPLVGGWIDVADGDLIAGLARLDALRSVEGFAILRHVHAALMQDIAGTPAAAGNAYAKAAAETEQISLRLAWLIGNFHERQGAPDQAAQVYERHLAHTSGSPVMEVLRQRLERATAAPAPAVATPSEGIAEALFNLAGLLNQQNAEDIALVYTRLALHMRPEFPVGRILLGEILQGQGRSREAIAAYRGVDADSPFHYVARLRIAEELDNLHDDEAAIAILEQTAAAYPAREQPMSRLGDLLRARERFAEAAEAYGRALQRVGKPENRHWMLYYFRGITLERTDRWAEAEEHFKMALKLEPQQPYVMNYLAYSWVEQRAHLDRALDMLDRAVELRPEDGYIVDSLGWVHYRLGNYAEAVRHLERAVELRPADPVINDHLGDAYWRVGRRQEARFQWHRALSLEPEADTVATIEAKLEHGLEASGRPNG